MNTNIDGIDPVSPTSDDDDDVINPKTLSINTTKATQRNSNTLYQQISSPDTNESNLVSSYNTAQQRMSFGGQAPSALVPSEDIDSKTLRDIQSVAPDDEENIK